MEKNMKKKKIIELILFVGILTVLTFSFQFISLIPVLGARLAVNCLCNLLLGCVAYAFIKKSGMKPDYGFRDGKTYLVGIGIAMVLQLLIGVIPALLGQSLVGSHTEFVLWNVLYQFFYFVLIIGPVEELIFRVYIQDSMIGLLPKYKWLAVILSSALFGFWHLIHGNFVQVLFTFIIGCAFGFSKCYLKNCKYSGVAVAHGFYDFMNVVTTILFVP